MKPTPVISVICPVLNEIGFIDGLLKYLVAVKPFDKECIFADGGSTDGTREVIEKYIGLYPEIIKLVNNPYKFVPHGLNLAVKQCKGNYIAQVNVHSTYDKDYFDQILKTFNETDADIVGGITHPAGTTNIQRAISKALSSGFATGKKKYQTITKKGFTDNVSDAAWKHEIFESIGFFEEELLRNHGEEFHFRAKKLRLKIYFNPEIRQWEYPRKHLSSLFNQYYLYGYYKPAVTLKVKSELKLRHFIPPVFTSYLLFVPAAFFYWKLLLPLALYSLIVLLFTIKSASNIKEFLVLPFIYPAIHLGYGLGFMNGLPKAIKNKLAKRKLRPKK